VNRIRHSLICAWLGNRQAAPELYGPAKTVAGRSRNTAADYRELAAECSRGETACCNARCPGRAFANGAAMAGTRRVGRAPGRISQSVKTKASKRQRGNKPFALDRLRRGLAFGNGLGRPHRAALRAPLATCRRSRYQPRASSRSLPSPTRRDIYR